MVDLVMPIMHTVSADGYLEFFLIYLIYFIIIGIFILLMKKLISNESLQIKRWKIITAFFITAFSIFLVRESYSKYLTNAHILIFITVTLSAIVSYFVWYVLLSSIAYLVNAVRDSKTKKNVKEIIGHIIILLLLNPISLQILLFIVLLGNNYVYMQNNVPCGIMIGNIIADSPAFLLDMQPGEIILSIDNRKITDLNGFVQYLSNKKPGEHIKIMTNTSEYDLILGQKPGSGSGFIGIGNLTIQYCKK